MATRQSPTAITFDHVIANLECLRDEYDRANLFAGVRRDFVRALANAVRTKRPQLAVEIGMANGLSSLAILAGLVANGTGRLISIDPFQSTDWGNRGRLAVQQAGLSHLHECREDYNFLALGDLIREKVTVDFAYVDGMHTFDHCLLDFFFLDQLLSISGVIGFNDCNIKGIHAVLRHVTRNRAYEEIDVGLPREYGSGLSAVKRRLEGRNGADRYFRKLANWRPAEQWNEFRYF